MAPSTEKKKPSYKRVTVEQKDKIIELHKLGYNGKQIDSKLGLSNNTANYHIRKMKDKAATRVGREMLTDVARAELIDLAKKGWTMTDLAKKFNVHVTTPGRILQKAGIKRPERKVEDMMKYAIKTPTVVTTDVEDIILENNLLKAQIALLTRKLEKFTK
jgi:lambda repressor-like predicted transcriptional regulator